jgi:hypothetical protein
MVSARYVNIDPVQFKHDWSKYTKTELKNIYQVSDCKLDSISTTLHLPSKKSVQNIYLKRGEPDITDVHAVRYRTGVQERRDKIADTFHEQSKRNMPATQVPRLTPQERKDKKNIHTSDTLEHATLKQISLAHEHILHEDDNTDTINETLVVKKQKKQR